MLRLNLILILLLTTCCSCVTPEKRLLTERCFVSLEFEKARCHQYEIGEHGLGRVGDSYDVPLDHINKKAVFTDWPKVWKFLEEWRQFLRDQDESSLSSTDTFSID